MYHPPTRVLVRSFLLVFSFRCVTKHTLSHAHVLSRVNTLEKPWVTRVVVVDANEKEKVRVSSRHGKRASPKRHDGNLGYFPRPVRGSTRWEKSVSRSHRMRAPDSRNVSFDTSARALKLESNVGAKLRVVLRVVVVVIVVVVWGRRP